MNNFLQTSGLTDFRGESHFALRGVRVLDQSGRFSEKTDVHVRNGFIEYVGSDRAITGNALDAEGTWLMPGLVDCHAHLGCFSNSTDEMMSMSVTRWTLESARSANTLLNLGITLVRDPATGDPGIRDGIASGAVPGPTLRVSGPALSQTGGHADGYVPSLGVEAMSGFLMPAYPGRGHSVVDGEDEMRRVVRQLVRSGVDWIKLCATGGLLSSMGDHPMRAEFTKVELAAAVEHADRAGIPVAAHAYGGDGLTDAVQAGVRSIEHGIFLTPQQADEMAERGCWLVPTLIVLEELKDLADAGEIDPWSAKKVTEVYELSGQQVAVARAAGVKIAMGSDLVVQGRNLEELAQLGRAGMTGPEVLLAATLGSTELLGMSHDRGRIAEGFIFDAVLLEEDPSDLSVFSRPEPVKAVFQSGHVVRPLKRWTSAQHGSL